MDQTRSLPWVVDLERFYCTLLTWQWIGNEGFTERPRFFLSCWSFRHLNLSTATNTLATEHTLLVLRVSGSLCYGTGDPDTCAIFDLRRRQRHRVKMILTWQVAADQGDVHVLNFAGRRNWNSDGCVSVLWRWVDVVCHAGLRRIILKILDVIWHRVDAK